MRRYLWNFCISHLEDGSKVARADTGSDSDRLNSFCGEATGMGLDCHWKRCISNKFISAHIRPVALVFVWQQVVPENAT